MAEIFFYNFSGRNLPDYARKDFDSMLVRDGLIFNTGYQLPFPGSDVPRIDLGGATVLPAFADAHVHFTQTGITMLGCQLGQTASVTELLEMVRLEGVDCEYVLGWNMQETKLREKRLPKVEELDRICAKNFVWLARADLHSAVVNTRALEWARTFFPAIAAPDGLIKGEEYNFLSYELNRLLPAAFKNKALRLAEQECFRNGVGTVHALEGCQKSGAETIAAADFFAASPLHGVIYHQSSDPALPIKKQWNRMGGCLLVDGSIGTRTAAMLKEYADAKTTGNLYLKAQEIEQLLTTANNNGLQLALHAIGDLALDTVTACYAWAADKYGKAHLAHRIEHFVLPTDKAIRNARQAAAMVCVQPAFDYFWGGPSGLYSQRLGATRAAGCNPFKTLLDIGIQLAGGSDSPVTPINPLLGIQALVNHTNPEERISLNAALAMFISEPHKLCGEEAIRGHLRKGLAADFVCLAEDPFKVPTAKLQNIRITDLYLAGRRAA